MKFTNKIFKLANIFQYKLKKYATEADSSLVTLTARPAANGIFGDKGVNIEKSLKSKPLKLMTELKVGGDIEMGGPIFISANKGSDGKWKISSLKMTTKVSGDAANNPKIMASVAEVEASYLKSLQAKLESEFNRVTDIGDGADTMTNIEVGANSASVGISF